MKSDEDEAIPHFPGKTLPIQRLAITDYEWQRPDPAAGALARLVLSSQLREFSLTGVVSYEVCTAIAEGLPHTTPLRFLSVLSLPPPETDQLQLFYQFLTICPNVAHLSIGWGETVPLPLPKPHGMLVRLESFYGPLPYAQLLVPASPVNDITVIIANPSDASFSNNMERLSPLAGSTVSIRRLGIRIRHLHWGPDYAAILGQIFPDLEELELTLIPNQPLVSTHIIT